MWPCHISPHLLCFQMTITLCTIVITLIKLHSHLRAAKCQLQSNLILRCDTLHPALSSVADHYDDDDHAPVSVMIFCSCHLMLFVSSTNYFQIVRRQYCLIWIDFFNKDIAGSPERTWVRDTDVLLLITTSQSQWRRGNVKLVKYIKRMGSDTKN